MEELARTPTGNAVGFDNLHTYRQVAEPFLLRDEPRNNLALGILNRLGERIDAFGPKPPHFWATRRSNGDLNGVALMTPPHALVLAGFESGDAVASVAQTLASQGVHIPGVIGPIPITKQFAGAWQQLTGNEMERVMRMGIYSLDAVTPPTVAGQARIATPHDRERLKDWLIAFNQEALGRSMQDDAFRGAEMARIERNLDNSLEDPLCNYYIWENDGVAVSMAGIGALTPNGARIGPVYTPAHERGRGYGSAITARVSQRALDSGKHFCFLYTDLSNVTSNSIYSKIGYRFGAESEEWKVIPE